ncbi:MAG: hypothetical protein CMJ81_19895 [Planctomycetaceae bacterium]|nr:hypothetical protein [Planctomycetaceae bacterium]MBP60969.1 hypothetical protein [Planctomycetaceae bacterium]
MKFSGHIVTPCSLFTTLVIVTCCSSVALAAEPTAKVDVILKSPFQRVPGTQPGNAAVYPDSSSSWFNHSVGTPTVDFDGQTYRMWFVGLSRTDDKRIPYGFAERIGLATSEDGIHWQVANDGQTVLDFGADGKFDDASLSHPYVLRIGNQFMMWYGGVNGQSGRDIGVGPPHVRVEQIGLATSSDGVHWTRANNGNPVLEIGPKGSIDAVQATGCHVIRQGDKFLMWYGAYNGTHTIGLATSEDGVHWHKENDGKSLSGLNGRQQLGPSVYFDGDCYLMFYNTIQQTPNGGALWTLFPASSSDGILWKPALDHQPILGAAPTGNFGSADGKTGNNHAVHPTKMVFFNHSVRMWYSAEGHQAAPGKQYAPSAIGLMEAVLQAPTTSNQ